MDENDPTATAERTPLETSVKPWEIDHAADELDRRARDLRGYALELSEDDEDATYAIRMLLADAREHVLAAAPLVHRAYELLKAAKDPDPEAS